MAQITVTVHAREVMAPDIAPATPQGPGLRHPAGGPVVLRLESLAVERREGVPRGQLGLVWRPPVDPVFTLARSVWRSRHQATARRTHYKQQGRKLRL
jgi:hypothetical protein